MKQMTQLGKMFVYVALQELLDTTKGFDKPSADITMCQNGTYELARQLEKLGVVKISVEPSEEEVPGGTVTVNWTYVSITEKGAKLVTRYLKVCSDELTKARFGKMKWDKRSKFHKELMSRIA